MNTYHLFIDFVAAFDSINKTKLYEAMTELCIPQKLIKLTKTTMLNVYSAVKIDKNKSRIFEVNNGLGQAAISAAEIDTQTAIFSHSSQILAFVDDIDLISRTVPNLKENFIPLEKAAEDIGLKINETKPKLMLISSVQNQHDRLGQDFILFRNPDRTRRQGRLKQRWLDGVESDMGALNIVNWRAIAHARTLWRNILTQAEIPGGL